MSEHLHCIEHEHPFVLHEQCWIQNWMDGAEITHHGPLGESARPGPPEVPYEGTVFSCGRMSRVLPTAPLHKEVSGCLVRS